MAAVHPKISEERSETIVSSTKSVTLRIKRSNPEVSSEEKFDKFIVPIEKWTTVLDALLDAKSHLDHSIGIRYSCRQASCGSCGMKINGKPALACFTKISELNSNDGVKVELSSGLMVMILSHPNVLIIFLAGSHAIKYQLFLYSFSKYG